MPPKTLGWLVLKSNLESTCRQKLLAKGRQWIHENSVVSDFVVAG